MALRILSYNIRFGGRGRLAEIAAVIRAADPDIVVLQEATDRAITRQLAELTGLPSWDSRTKSSTGFLTRLEVVQYAWHQPRPARHAFLELQVREPALRVFGLHLSAWFSKWSERRRAVEIHALLEAIRAHQDGFHLIAGDFNALAPGELLQAERMPRWIQAMVWLSGRDIARDTIQRMLDEKYIDAWRTLHPDEKGYTFPTWDPHVRFDYLFLPERYQSRITHCSVFSAAPSAIQASDHFPLVVDLD